MKIQVYIYWGKLESGIYGNITVYTPKPVKVHNPFKGCEVDGVELVELRNESNVYKSQLAFFRYIVNEYYTNKRYKWESVIDEPAANTIIIEGEDTKTTH